MESFLWERRKAFWVEGGEEKSDYPQARALGSTQNTRRVVAGSSVPKEAETGVLGQYLNASRRPTTNFTFVSLQFGSFLESILFPP